MVKLLIGGSPCTHWSIAQKNNRETEPKGLGWELFVNYLLAKEKFKPDFFLYENNKSAAQPIKDEIKKQLGVWDNTLLSTDSGARYIEINSALVSAQNRQRFYVHNCGEVEQPADRGILLRDILETGIPYQEKGYPLRANCGGGCFAHDYIKSNRSFVAEAIRIGTIENSAQNEKHDSKQYRVYSPDGKATTLCGQGGGGGAKTGLYAAPVCVQEQVHGRKASLDGTFDRRYEARTDGKSGTLTGTNRQNAVAIPIENVGDAETIQKALPKLVKKYGYIPEIFNAYNVAELDEKSPTLSTGSMATSSCATTIFVKVNDKEYPVYKVENGLITIKGKQYPIKLADGYYIIRKLTVKECCRLQTLPDDYCRAVSNAQAYKGLGNGWTAEVIIHILQHALKDIPKNEEIVVLSMYDGIGTGRYCLDKMGFTNIRYYAYEIDKYAMEVALSNYPDIIQCGDAFQLRNNDWELRQEQTDAFYKAKITADKLADNAVRQRQLNVELNEALDILGVDDSDEEFENAMAYVEGDCDSRWLVEYLREKIGGQIYGCYG